MQALYERRADDVERMRAEGEPDGFEAAALGDRERLEALLDGDPALLGARSPDGFTVLHLAAFFGHGPLVQWLLERGADPGPVAENPMRVQPLHSAVAARNGDAVRALLAAGADPDARQQRGITALHAAAVHGDDDMVGALMDAGADPTLADDEGTTAPAYARRGGFLDIARGLGG